MFGSPFPRGGNVPVDYFLYYDLETYLFDTVHRRFHQEKKLDAFDLFSIIIWKAERAKSRLAHRLINQAGSLEAAAERFTSALYEAGSPEARLMMTMEGWGFYLPMASAILTVLWPEDFTVFDTRACEQLRELKIGEFAHLANVNANHLWPMYVEYCNAVKRAVPQFDSLRDKDRFLWGRSAARQLVKDIEGGFPGASEAGVELSSTVDEEAPRG